MFRKSDTNCVHDRGSKKESFSLILGPQSHFFDRKERKTNFYSTKLLNMPSSLFDTSLETFLDGHQGCRGDIGFWPLPSASWLSKINQHFEVSLWKQFVSDFQKLGLKTKPHDRKRHKRKKYVDFPMYLGDIRKTKCSEVVRHPVHLDGVSYIFQQLRTSEIPPHRKSHESK